MGKMTTFVIVMSGITLLFYFTGLIGTNPLFELLFNPEDMTQLDFYTILLTGIVSTGAAIVIGFFSKNVELAAATLFAPVIMALLWNFIKVFNAIAAVNKVFAVLIIAPSLFMYWVTIMEWWRGRD